MIRYIAITKEEQKKPYKVSYIYYGDIYQGARFSKTIGPRHHDYKKVDKIYKQLKEMAYGTTYEGETKMK